jgi:hypothetical protein
MYSPSGSWLPPSKGTVVSCTHGDPLIERNTDRNPKVISLCSDLFLANILSTAKSASFARSCCAPKGITAVNACSNFDFLWLHS